jgi:hypothetical protein
MVRALAAEHTDRQIADTLNGRWLRTGTGQLFTRLRVRHIRTAHGIPSLADHLRRAGWLTATEIAAQLGVHHTTAKRFACEGVLRALRADDGASMLFEPLTGPLPRAHPGKRFRDRRRYPQCASHKRSCSMKPDACPVAWQGAPGESRCCSGGRARRRCAGPRARSGRES